MSARSYRSHTDEAQGQVEQEKGVLSELPSGRALEALCWICVFGKGREESRDTLNELFDRKLIATGDSYRVSDSMGSCGSVTVYTYVITEKGKQVLSKAYSIFTKRELLDMIHKDLETVQTEWLLDVLQFTREAKANGETITDPASVLRRLSRGTSQTRLDAEERKEENAPKNSA